MTQRSLEIEMQPDESLLADFRSVLRANNALLVHFSSEMATFGREYPYDLIDCMANPQWELATCTVLPTSMAATLPPGGHIGLILDPNRGASVVKVHSGKHMDAGSSVDAKTGKRVGFGQEPTLESMRANLIPQETYTEWVLKDCTVRGVFLYNVNNMTCFKSHKDPIYGKVQTPVTIKDVFPIFPILRIITNSNGNYVEIQPDLSTRMIEHNAIYPW